MSTSNANDRPAWIRQMQRYAPEVTASILITVAVAVMGTGAFGIAGLLLILALYLSIAFWRRLQATQVSLATLLALVVGFSVLAGAVGFRIAQYSMPDRAPWEAEGRAPMVSFPIWHTFKTTLVQGQHFLNQEVLLDGATYDGCTFSNVTFFFNGTAPTALINPTFTGSSALRTLNGAVANMMRIQKALGFLRPEIQVARDAQELLPPGAATP